MGLERRCPRPAGRGSGAVRRDLLGAARLAGAAPAGEWPRGGLHRRAVLAARFRRRFDIAPVVLGRGRLRQSQHRGDRCARRVRLATRDRCAGRRRNAHAIRHDVGPWLARNDREASDPVHCGRGLPGDVNSVVGSAHSKHTRGRRNASCHRHPDEGREGRRVDDRRTRLRARRARASDRCRPARLHHRHPGDVPHGNTAGVASRSLGGTAVAGRRPRRPRAAGHAEAGTR